MPNLTTGNITISPGSGNNTESLAITAMATNSRSPKSIELKARGTGNYSGIESSNTLYITQEGLGNIVRFQEAAILDSGGSVTLNGTCNLQTITVANKSGETNNLLDYLSSATMQVAGSSPVDITTALTSLSHSYEPVGDPGDTTPYTLTLVFSGIPSTVDTKTWYIVVGDVEVSVRQDAHSPSQPSASFTSTNSSYRVGENIVVPFTASADSTNAVEITVENGPLSWSIEEF